MTAEVLEKVTALIRAVADLANVLGSGVFSLLVIVVAALIVGVPWYSERQRNKRADLVVEHKEKEIQRLAEDNRRYRDVYLKRLGFPEPSLAADAEDSKRAAEERKKKGKTT